MKGRAGSGVCRAEDKVGADTGDACTGKILLALTSTDALRTDVLYTLVAPAGSIAREEEGAGMIIVSGIAEAASDEGGNAAKVVDTAGISTGPIDSGLLLALTEAVTAGRAGILVMF